MLTEFERVAERGGVLGAMEIGGQSSKIKEESRHGEMFKHTDVNTLHIPHDGAVMENIELARSTEDEKQSQLQRLPAFQTAHAAESGVMLLRLQQAVIANQNVFDVLMDAVRARSLSQITSEGENFCSERLSDQADEAQEPQRTPGT